MTETEKKSPVGDSKQLNSREQQSMDLDSTADMIRRLMRNQAARIRFVDSHLAKGVAFQIQSMRAKKEWSQEELAQHLGSNQNAVYRLENPNYGKQTITTLKKVAAAFDVALVVRFVPFSQLVDWVGGKPYIDPGLSEDALAVPSFDDEMKAGVFDQPAEKVDDIRIATESVRKSVRESIIKSVKALELAIGYPPIMPLTAGRVGVQTRERESRFWGRNERRGKSRPKRRFGPTGIRGTISRSSEDIYGRSKTAGASNWCVGLGQS